MGQLATLFFSLLLVVAVGACGGSETAAGGDTTSAVASDAADTGAGAIADVGATSGSQQSDVTVDKDVGPAAAEDVADDATATVDPDDAAAEVVDGCPAGTPCDDGDPCTDGDTCDAAGSCAGAALVCDDGLECTNDACVDGACVGTPANGYCIHEGICVPNLQPSPLESCVFCLASAGGPPEMKPYSDGAPCEDADPCTSGSHCELGVCKAGSSKDCDDGNACMDWLCETGVGCVGTPNATPCDDGDACTEGDGCADGGCAAGATPTDCDDGDPCSVDGCHVLTGCSHAFGVVCEDLNPCTADVCLADGTCEHSPITGPCDDGDACTVGESCVDNACVGGEPNDCEDGQVCTVDSCSSLDGCVNQFVEGSCDDGTACTIEDTCVAGLCIGEKSGCTTCPVPVTTHAIKVTHVEIASDGYQGSGLDVDFDPDTCAPPGDCSGGVDNALAVFAPLLNDAMAEALLEGTLMWVIDLSEATFDGQPFPLAVLDSELSDDSILAGCDYQAESCVYNVEQFSYDGDCEPYFALEDVVIADAEMNGGGTGQSLTMGLALAPGVFVPVTVLAAQMSATLTIVPDGQGGQKIVGMEGFVAGATPKEQLIETIVGINSDLFPVDKETALFFLEQLIENDLDVDNDGVNESASIGIRFTGIPAVLE